METLGRGKRILWVSMFCKVVGDPPKGGGKRSCQELSRGRSMEGDLRRVQMRCGPTFPKGTP